MTIDVIDIRKKFLLFISYDQNCKQDISLLISKYNKNIKFSNVKNYQLQMIAIKSLFDSNDLEVNSHNISIERMVSKDPFIDKNIKSFMKKFGLHEKVVKRQEPVNKKLHTLNERTKRANSNAIVNESSRGVDESIENDIFNQKIVKGGNGFGKK